VDAQSVLKTSWKFLSCKFSNMSGGRARYIVPPTVTTLGQMKVKL
jgi:hypothetical protein